MSKPSVVIQPIDFDVATRAVEKFSQERQIPSMVFPETAAGQGVGAGEDRPALASVSASYPFEPLAVAPIRDRRTMKRIPVELPAYVFDDIKRRALDGDCSARHIIMKALRSYGVHIADDDMPEDGRRNR